MHGSLHYVRILTFQKCSNVILSTDEFHQFDTMDLVGNLQLVKEDLFIAGGQSVAVNLFILKVVFVLTHIHVIKYL